MGRMMRGRGGGGWRRALLLVLFVGLVCGVRGVTNNLALLNEIFGEISNAGSIGWPVTDPCGSGWEKVQCSSSGDVITMFLKDSGLEGTLSGKIAQLPGFTRLDAQNNNFTGAMPSFANVKTLTTLFLANNQFTSIPRDFFDGLTGAQVLSLDNNPGLNGTAGWSLPAGLAQATALQNLTLSRCNVVGSIPEFIGTFGQLSVLNLGGNGMSGGIPATFSSLAGLTQLKLNGQGGSGGGLSGPITVVGSIPALNTLWLQQNSFSGTIPEELGNVLGLTDVELNDNDLVGTIPASISELNQLKVFNVENNRLVGQIPSLPGTTVTYDGNNFCSTGPGVNCSAQTTALIGFLADVNFPSALSTWGGADPCTTTPAWLGVVCTTGAVTSISLASLNLTGTLSDTLGDLQGLTQLKLAGNHLFGTIPASLAALPNIKVVDLSNNNFSGPVPTFPAGVLLISGNPLISGSGSPSPPGTPSPPSSPGTPPSPGSPPSNTPGTPQGSGNGTSAGSPKSSSVSVGLVAGSVVGAVAILALIALCAYFVYRRKRVGAWRVQSPNNLIEPHRESDEVVKIVVGNGSPSESDGRAHSGPSSIPVEGGNFIISMQILREVTNNFSDENILGRGGFGVVYKGELGDGTKIAVKRMEAAAVSNKGMDEFQAEIQVLTKVRHRHLVGLLGYCVDGNEKLLVYEYMPQGTLSQHLFEYARYECKALTWKQRLVIALDVARGIEYLHGLAHKSFIHRDLKPSNILLGDDLRAKVSDFGLVKLAPEGKYSVETRLAGTFGYLAPEYAVTGRVTTKADVFSFGVILMELITGRKALDETQSEENVHLVTWFKRMNMNKEALQRACDISIELSEETFQSITTVAELAGHCTAREPYQRPDMGHAVNVLAPLVERWKPTSFDAEDSAGIDLELTLPQALKRWQAYEDSSVSDMDRTEASLPNPPPGFVDSFTSADGR